MKQYPILMRPELVLATLEGRKTQTRRLNHRAEVGDVLWVKETWCQSGQECNKPYYLYRADKAPAVAQSMKWKPSLFMPKVACRLFLLVTAVRWEALQEILCNDMLAEGCIPKGVTGGQWQQWQRDYFMPLWDSINTKPGATWRDNPQVKVITFDPIEMEAK